MAHQPPSGVFIVYPQFKGLDKLRHRPDNCRCLRVFYQAVTDWYNCVCPLLIRSCNNLILYLTKYRMYFISIMIWIIHPCHIIDFSTILPNMCDNLRFLFRQFLLIAFFPDMAGATLCHIGTRLRFSIFLSHKNPSKQPTPANRAGEMIFPAYTQEKTEQSFDDCPALFHTVLLSYLCIVAAEKELEYCNDCQKT